MVYFPEQCKNVGNNVVKIIVINNKNQKKVYRERKKIVNRTYKEYYE